MYICMYVCMYVSILYYKTYLSFPRSKDAPYFGRCVSCGTEEDLYRWLAGMIHAQVRSYR